ncbi:MULTISPECIES: hypothetical protein [Bacillus]|uniref:Uncharacterized protein n=1 Tax=Bacillus cereus (strain ATCC 14579 / DSM 31 / CCUG 7414 / JCM 2152 / NBRC 15305 / NCIMB 9373 / NCTC 2599 / NRRL B-3711) TaxID=226900 RepID=Q815M1_BACCR|nr:hypothetical protein [Bacillus cereus]AAP11990.1 hypothetical protein BC_5121 [Bacillus cereus ATCC 14579]EEL08944.1 hypothetical protein bcere0015_48000 [Bacillus cereus BDRD-Cer4]ETT80135.1 hypothetical protein C175_16037 [Bacillus cereus]KZD83372.1 hypothetical protein B4155_2223 [Bacillus cereus]MCC3288470.1 hypothetical protein [Bacillus cereus]
MNYFLSGIGTAKSSLHQQFRKKNFQVRPVNYFEISDLPKESILFLVYDGLYIEEFLSSVKAVNCNVIPIFFDVDTVIIPGVHKPEYQKGEICIECSIARLKEYYFNSTMYEKLFMKKDYSLVENVLEVEFSIFAQSFISAFKETGFVGQNSIYSFDYYTFKNKQILGYTKCKKCDFHDYSSDEMINQLNEVLDCVAINK